ADRLLQNRQGQRHDQPGALGDGNELSGGEQAACRVLPARERLDADELAGGQADLWLVVQDDRAAGNGTAELTEQVQLLNRRGFLLGVIDGEAGPGELGGVHGDVGLTQQPIHVVARLGDGNADGAVNLQADAIDV